MWKCPVFPVFSRLCSRIAFKHRLWTLSWDCISENTSSVPLLLTPIPTAVFQLQQSRRLPAICSPCLITIIISWEVCQILGMKVSNPGNESASLKSLNKSEGFPVNLLNIMSWFSPRFASSSFFIVHIDLLLTPRNIWLLCIAVLYRI